MANDALGLAGKLHMMRVAAQREHMPFIAGLVRAAEEALVCAHALLKDPKVGEGGL